MYEHPFKALPGSCFLIATAATSKRESPYNTYLHNPPCIMLTG